MIQRGIFVKASSLESLRCVEPRVVNSNNSFDCIRHLAALALLVSYHYRASGFGFDAEGI